MVRAFRKVSIILCFLSGGLFAGNDEELFLRANKLYESHEYEKALSLYEMMSHKGRAVLYNMGNCYFHNNDYAKAFAYWMKAEKGATSQEIAAISQNKRYALDKMSKQDSCAEGVLSKFIQFFDGISSSFSLILIQILFLCIWYLLFFFRYRYGIKKKSISFVCAMSLCLLGSVMVFQHVKRSTISGVVIERQASIFSGPDHGFDKIGTVNSADCVVIKDIRKGWYKVKYSDSIGWVEADAIQIL